MLSRQRRTKGKIASRPATPATELVAFEGRTKYYLWSIFLFSAVSGFYRPVSTSESSTGISLVCSAIVFGISAAWLLEIANGWNVLNQVFARSPGIRAVFWMFLATVIMAAVWGSRNVLGSSGALQGLRSYFFETMPMLLCVLIMIGARPAMIRALPSILLVQTGISVPFFILVMLLYPTFGARDTFGGPHHTASAMLSISVSTICMLDKYKIAGRIVAIISYIAYAVANIVYQSRGGVIVAFVAVPLYLVVTWVLGARQRPRERGKITFQTVASIALACVIVAMVAAFVPSVRQQLRIDLSSTMYRLYGGEEEEAVAVGFKENTMLEFETSRGAEAQDYLGQMDVVQFLVGKGFAGSWYSKFWGNEWVMVHFGPLHLILKGGILMLLSFTALIAIGAVRAWKNASRDTIFTAAGGVILAYYLGFLKHGPLALGYDSIVFWLLLGTALAGPLPLSESLFRTTFRR